MCEPFFSDQINAVEVGSHASPLAVAVGIHYRLGTKSDVMMGANQSSAPTSASASAGAGAGAGARAGAGAGAGNQTPPSKNSNSSIASSPAAASPETKDDGSKKGHKRYGSGGGKGDASQRQLLDEVHAEANAVAQALADEQKSQQQQQQQQQTKTASVCLMFFSDTHGGHREIPSVSSQLSAVSKSVDPTTHQMTHIFLHSGDFCRKYRTETSDDFNDWLSGDDNPFLKSIPKEHKIVILGNHEEDGSPAFPKAMNFGDQQNFTFLRNQTTQLAVELGGFGAEGSSVGLLNVFGSSYHLPDPRSSEWQTILQMMASSDIILTHAPARKVDRMHHPQLVEALRLIEQVPPPNLKRRIHCSGHAHERHFTVRDDARADKMIWVGAAQSQVDQNGEPFMAPPRVIHLVAADFHASTIVSKEKFLEEQKQQQKQQQQQR